jgi:hypothetical protein
VRIGITNSFFRERRVNAKKISYNGEIKGKKHEKRKRNVANIEKKLAVLRNDRQLNRTLIKIKEETAA